jgi:hypothetical protein
MQSSITYRHSNLPEDSISVCYAWMVWVRLLELDDNVSVYTLVLRLVGMSASLGTRQ